MKWARAIAVCLISVFCGVGCGSQKATPPTPLPTPAPTPTPPIDSVVLATSVPPPGGIVHTGLTNPASSLEAGVTTGLTMNFSVASAVDRAAKLQVYLTTAANSTCLTNAAPIDVPTAPLVHLSAGVVQTVTVRQLLLTSECFYPGLITTATARLVPPSAVGTGQPAFYETRFAVQYTVVK